MRTVAITGGTDGTGRALVDVYEITEKLLAT